MKKPETINYRTFKPEKDGLFCEKHLRAGQGLGVQLRQVQAHPLPGVVCDRCGVEVTQAKVRRERMGHIELAVPVSHIWYFKGVPCRIGHLLDMSIRNLERIIYYESYVVIDPGNTPLQKQRAPHRGRSTRSCRSSTASMLQGQDGRRGHPRAARRDRPRGAGARSCAPRCKIETSVQRKQGHRSSA